MIESHLVLSLFKTNQLLYFCSMQSLVHCHSLSTPAERTNTLPMLSLLETHLQKMHFRFVGEFISHSLRVLMGKMV